MTKDAARFLLDLLNHQQLSVGAPDFDDTVAKVLVARAELVSILAEPGSAPQR